METLLNRKVEIELNNTCPHNLDCTKCAEACAALIEYNNICDEIDRREQHMRRWVIADLHFGHANVIKYAGRPYENIEQMEKDLIKRWNNTVAKEDIVYVLGDFTLSRDKDYITRLCGALNGTKVLIMGNHDTRNPIDYLLCGFKTATRKPILVDSRVVLSHEPIAADDIVSGMIYIHGHTHEKPCYTDSLINCACVSVERIDYTPVDLDKLIKDLKKKVN